MARLCTVCTHAQRREIDAALLEHSVGYRVIARRYGLVLRSVQRHADNHLAVLIRQSKELRQMLDAQNLTAELGKWHERMEDQYHKADHADNVLAAVATARTGIAAIEAFSRIGALAEIEQRLQALEDATPTPTSARVRYHRSGDGDGDDDGDAY